MTKAYITGLSIIVPTHNRAAILRRCLDALACQTAGADRFEVIVSDDGSGDDTPEVVTSYSRNKLPYVVYLQQENRGASAARNRALEQANGKLVLMINDDTIPTATLVQHHLALHSAYPPENVAVLGRVALAPELPPTIFAKLHLDAIYESIAQQEELSWRYFLTCNLSVKRSFVLEHGLFEESIPVQHEDVELGERLSHHGLRIRYCPEALAYHHHFIDEKTFLSSAVTDGRSLARWFKKSPQLKRELTEAGFYLTAPMGRRVSCQMADLVVNRSTIPVLLMVARKLASHREPVALAIYSKIYQALKREAIRDALRS